MKPGDRIGHIQISELLGRGGMGDVYAGFDEKLQRDVAIKVLREGRWQRVARARLLREARALSRLDHPHICAIYDLIETPEGDALVLERIVGKNLRQVVRSGKLDRVARLRIAEELAEVLVAAHAHGIVHRDLKPTNVLLTAEGAVKVLDFGLAYSPEDGEVALVRSLRPAGEGAGEASASKEPLDEDLETAELRYSSEDSSLERESTETYRTQFGEVVGTLPSMSPEQARGEPVTFASDLYAFGLLLQELFTGQSAYDSTMPTPRLLYEVQEGRRRPLSGVGAGHAELIRALCAVAPEDRPTAAATLARLRRIREAPKRWALRAALTAAMLLALAGVAKYTFDLKRERDAAIASEERAERAGGEAEGVVDFLVGMFRVADPGESLGNRITARELLDRGAESLKTDLANQPTRRARLADAIGQTYQRLGLYPQAEALLSEALELNRRQLGNDSAEVGMSLYHLGALHLITFGESEKTLTEAVRILEKAKGPNAPDLAAALNGLGTFYGRKGDAARAEPLLNRALAIRVKVLGPEDPSVAATLNNLAIVASRRGDFKRAESLFRRGLAIREKVLPPDHPDVAVNLEALAVLYDSMDQPRVGVVLHRRALAIWEKVLGPSHPRLGLLLSNLANTENALGARREAEALHRRALAIREAAYGPDHPDVAISLHGLASVLWDEGRKVEAEATLRRALTIQNRHLDGDDVERRGTLTDLAAMLRATGRAGEAAAILAILPAPPALASPAPPAAAVKLKPS